MSRIFEIVAISGLFLTSVASADNWGHWRGPTGNGVALNANPPIEWNESKNVKWKVKLPSRENSSPVVWGDRVFIVAGVSKGGKQTSEPTEMEFETHCYSRKNGDLLWKKVVTSGKPHQKTHETNGFTSASPCTDGKHVYAHFGSRGLYCYTLDGNLVWKRDDFGKMETLNGFGEGSSPTIEGETIIVPWDHQGPSALYLLNKQTGDTIWKTDRDEPTGWATPLVVEHAGRKQIIMNGENFARG
ncbi:MAG: PQQ-like beta-propeller repeat protein, partial [Planctomycetes bacterium]|nr:PQQ-like beta-propeller repeat protein [Planctomycetota bacterium]